MLDAAELVAHVEANGPWLYHATPEECVASILQTGLRPGSDLGRSNARDAFHRTRSGHVYLWTAEHHARVRGDVGPATIRVDLRCLDPDRIDPDEDMVQASFLSEFIGGTDDPWIDAWPPFLDPGWEEGPNGERTLAHWADTTPGFDAPAVTARSLQRGRIAYRGTVPPDALEAIPWSS